ncbi:MAG: glycosyltransferase family 2 protein, partial [Gemmatimonadaceae bacterium]
MERDNGITYILPIRSLVSQAAGELGAYVQWLAARAETIVVDGSPAAVFAAHADAWGGVARHVPPDADLVTPMGKVGGVLTGVRLASHERLVIADDDVRYDDEALRRVIRALDDADVVRPQNYFRPLPWHARWDTGRSLLNRVTGGDWPGTLGVRRSVLRRTGGYDGAAMFENLELVRTVVAAGGREAVLLDAFVARRPSTARHFWSQRVRQAYDELARPSRLAAQLAVLPATLLLGAALGWRALAAGAALVVGVAEVGRRRAGGARVFPASAALLAPAWLAERAVCSWLAVGARVVLGGVPYRGTVLRHAATPMRVLRSRHAPARPPPG